MSTDISTTDEALLLMMNPINLQHRIISGLEEKLLNGTAIIPDPNSVAMHLIESFSCVTADFAKATQRATERRLPPRAQTDADLFLHMSDYDTVGSFGTPSQITIALSIDKNYILTHGELVNNSYRRVQIPADTVITIGNLTFGIYYPINIQVDERTKIPLVSYDISTQHPLMALSSNRVPFYEFTYTGYDLIVIELTVYQFVRSTLTITLDSDIGFSETLTFADQFYAVRLFTTVNGKRVELAQSMVQENYDATIPTARVQVMQDTSQFLVNIPQIYFTNGLMGPTIEYELYTTKGAINSSVGGSDSQVKINFQLDGKPRNPATDPMRFNPTLFANVKSPKTVGGTDGYTYEEKRQRVINGSFRTKAQITPIDLQNYYADYGIKVERYEDNLTNLTYFIYKPFTDNNNQIIQSTNTYLGIYPETPTKTSSVKRSPDNSITVLPSTWYRYKDAEDLCVPLTDDELKFISEMDKATLAAEFNENSYVRSPFHIRLKPNDIYTYAKSYNLMQPKIEKVTVTEENPNSLAQMLIVSETIEHLSDGAGGYKLTFIVKKDLMTHVPEAATTVWLYTTSVDGIQVGVKATYAGTVDDHCIYEVKLATNYWIDDKDNIELTSLTDSITNITYRVTLDSKFHVVFMCASSYFPTTNTPSSLYAGVPLKMRADTIVLLRQSMDVHFGHALDDVIHNSVNLPWQPKKYRRHVVDVPNLYTKDIYEVDANGVEVVHDVDGTPMLNLLHKKGDPVIGEDGQPEYLYRVGDIWLDTDGQPVVLENRNREYPVMASVFDGRVFISEHPTQKAFVSGLVAMFESYFNIIRDARGYITERTNVYFKASKTTGNAVFRTGNGVKLTMPLDMKMAFRMHVDPQVNISDTIKESVRTAAIRIIEPALTTDIISQTEISDTIKNNVYYVHSVDSLGINNDMKLQTVQVVDSSSQPSLKKKLVVSADNQLVLTDDISIDYVDVN